MANTFNSTYKRFNGTDWDTIYFKTTAGQVVETTAKRFLVPATHTVNGLKFFDSNNNAQSIVLTGANINVSATDSTKVSAAISNVTTKANNNGTAITQLQNTVNAIPTTYATKTELNGVVTDYQQLFNYLQEYIDEVDETITDLIEGAPEAYDTLKEIADYITTDKSGASSMLANINTNTADIKTLKASVTANANEISNIGGTITTIQGNVSQNTTKLNSLTTTVTNNYNELTLAIQGKINHFYGSTTPTGALEGDIWLETA